MADSDLFFTRTGMDRGRVQQTVDEALKGSDDGELYLEYSQSESFAFDDGRLKAATFDTSQVSACGPWRAKPPATPMPAKFRKTPSGARRARCAPSATAIPARWPPPRPAATSSSIPTSTR